MIHQLRDVSQSLRSGSKQQMLTASPQHSQTSGQNQKRGNDSDGRKINNAVDIAAGKSGVCWMDAAEWQAFVEWMDRWIEDLICRLGGSVEAPVSVAPPHLMSPDDLSSPPGSLRKRRCV